MLGIVESIPLWWGWWFGFGVYLCVFAVFLLVVLGFLGEVFFPHLNKWLGFFGINWFWIIFNSHLPVHRAFLPQPMVNGNCSPEMWFNWVIPPNNDLESEQLKPHCRWVMERLKHTSHSQENPKLSGEISVFKLDYLKWAHGWVWVSFIYF